MIQLRLRTEYGTRVRSYGRIADVLTVAGGSAAAMTDSSVFGHVSWYEDCRARGIQPILGAECAVLYDPASTEGQPTAGMAFLPTTVAALQELYELLTVAHRQFVRRPRLSYAQVNAVSSDLIVLSGINPAMDLLKNRPNVYLELNPAGGPWNARAMSARGWQRIICSDNYYPTLADAAVYEIHSSFARVTRRAPMHILDEWELRAAVPEATDEEFLNTERVAAACAGVTLPKAENVRYRPEATLRALCEQGMQGRGLAVTPAYDARLTRELAMIQEKNFEDYFYVIADLVQEAKRTMLVGPARGSSAGSLVCYALGITDVDPIRHGLMFERFIDITRADLPDIDLDFPDTRRDGVMAYLREKYGAPRVGRIGTVLRYKAKSAIGLVAKTLGVPVWETKDLASAVIDRSTGDARAQFGVKDALEGLEIGRKLVAKYPGMRMAGQLEGHAQTTGTHAAGLIVANEPVARYCVTGRDGTSEMDKHDAEALNLLKIDALGLRTLTILQDVLESVGKSRQWLIDYPLDDVEAFEIFNLERWSGLFQFEGYALQSLTRQMKVRCFDDIVIISALARPGPLHNGMATQFIARRLGQEAVTYLHPLAEPITRETLGIIVYQEQVMAMGRVMGQLSWEDVSTLRKAMSKSMGEEFFNQYWEKFRAGTRAHGVPDEEAHDIWKKLCTFGCVSGETKLELLGCASAVTTIAALYQDQTKQPALLWNKQEDSLRSARVLDVYQSGVQQTFELALTNGHTLRATADHNIWTRAGWVALGALQPDTEVAVAGERVMPGSRQIAWSKVVRVGSPRTEMTYDLAMPDPHHNFVANGIVIKNSWAFNKSHAVSYGMLSYWCAMLRAHYPLEFAAASLRNERTEEGSVKVLRDLVREGYTYKAVDVARSTETWSILDGQLVGGLRAIKGLGPVKVAAVLAARASGAPVPPGVAKLLANAVTPYDDIFECERRYGAMYADPERYRILSAPLTVIADIGATGTYNFIGRLMEKNLRDLNEYGNVVKRGGRLVPEGSNLFLNLVVEDDTGSIILRVTPREYARIGTEIVEQRKIGDWLLWSGLIRDNWRLIYVSKCRVLPATAEEYRQSLYAAVPLLSPQP